MNHKKLTVDAELEKLQRESFDYFLHEVNPSNGLILDKTAVNWPSSIAAIGFGLASYPVAVERSFMSRTDAAERTLNTLRFFWNSPQGIEPDATGYKGFYYHFLDMKSGRRAWQCELSTIDTAILLAGMLTACAYFDANNAKEKEIRTLADALYSRVDWPWAQNQGDTVSLGWTPESGFISYRWDGYDEGIIIYILGLGSPTFPLPQQSYTAWVDSYRWEQIYGYDYLYAGSFFTHQFSHIWIDFRHIQDAVMRAKGSDYFENSRSATYVQQQYAIHNPLNLVGYSERCWGITASDGPGPATLVINGIKREFFDYLARSVPEGPDDGTISPWSAITSLPFAPEIVLPMIDHCIYNLKLKEGKRYGFNSTFNQTYQTPDYPQGWVSPWHYGINQGPVVLMIENYRSGLVWSLMRSSPYIVDGLKRAGFTGGWLRQ